MRELIYYTGYTLITPFYMRFPWWPKWQKRKKVEECRPHDWPDIHNRKDLTITIFRFVRLVVKTIVAIIGLFIAYLTLAVSVEPIVFVAPDEHLTWNSVTNDATYNLVLKNHSIVTVSNVDIDLQLFQLGFTENTKELSVCFHGFAREKMSEDSFAALIQNNFLMPRAEEAFSDIRPRKEIAVSFTPGPERVRALVDPRHVLPNETDQYTVLRVSVRYMNPWNNRYYDYFKYFLVTNDGLVDMERHPDLVYFQVNAPGACLRENQENCVPSLEQPFMHDTFIQEMNQLQPGSLVGGRECVPFSSNMLYYSRYDSTPQRYQKIF